MINDISKLELNELQDIYLQQRISFANGVDKRLPWDQLKEICSFLAIISQEMKKREQL